MNRRPWRRGRDKGGGFRVPVDDHVAERRRARAGQGDGEQNRAKDRLHVVLPNIAASRVVPSLSAARAMLARELRHAAAPYLHAISRCASSISKNCMKGPSAAAIIPASGHNCGG